MHRLNDRFLNGTVGNNNSQDNGINRTFREFLSARADDYIGEVPSHWLDQEQPSQTTLLVISIAFLIICIPGNISQILVIAAYAR